jgi:hypothetical protein
MHSPFTVTSLSHAWFFVAASPLTLAVVKEQFKNAKIVPVSFPHFLYTQRSTKQLPWPPV